MKKQYLQQLLRDAGFTSFKDKNNIIRYQQGGNYTLRHGEYDRPDYRILKVRGKDAYYISAHYWFYNNTFNVPKDGPLSEEQYYWLQERAEYLKEE